MDGRGTATTGTVAFNTWSDDEVRLWVNGALLIDDWNDHAPTENSKKVNLTGGGQRHTITLEYYDNTGGAEVKLEWKPPGFVSKSVIPLTRLFPPSASSLGPFGPDSIEGEDGAGADVDEGAGEEEKPRTGTPPRDAARQSATAITKPNSNQSWSEPGAVALAVAMPGSKAGLAAQQVGQAGQPGQARQGAQGPAGVLTTNTLVYLVGDHLGSTSVVYSSDGQKIGEQEFDPWGKVRPGGNVTQTKQNFTGQKLDGTGLLFYNARYYDPGLGRFTSPDSIVPGASSGVGGAGGAGGIKGIIQNSKLTVDFHEESSSLSTNDENGLTPIARFCSAFGDTFRWQLG